MPKAFDQSIEGLTPGEVFAQHQTLLSNVIAGYETQLATLTFSKTDFQQMEDQLGDLQCQLAQFAWRVVSHDDVSEAGLQAKAQVVLEYADNDGDDLVQSAACALARGVLHAK